MTAPLRSDMLADSDADGSDHARILSHLPYLDDSDWAVRERALSILYELEPTLVAQHADAVVGRLEDSDAKVRTWALLMLGRLEPEALAQHANAIVARLEDSDWYVRRAALETLGKLEPVTLAQHAGAVVARLKDSGSDVRSEALRTLCKLKPATLAQHADAMVARLKNWYPGAIRRRAILETLRALPRFIIRDIDLIPRSGLGPWLLARLAWYRCRLRLRVRRLALYWYALPYRPNGPGHARDVEAWGRILEE